jgi:hypothetical protein
LVFGAYLFCGRIEQGSASRSEAERPIAQKSLVFAEIAE